MFHARHSPSAIVTSPNSIVICKLNGGVESRRFSFISSCITSVFPAHGSQTISIARDLLLGSVKRALLSVKGSHKFETERNSRLGTVNQAFCQLAQGARLPATFLTPCILVFVIRGKGGELGWRKVRRAGRLETPRVA